MSGPLRALIASKLNVKLSNDQIYMIILFDEFHEYYLNMFSILDKIPKRGQVYIFCKTELN